MYRLVSLLTNMWVNLKPLHTTLQTMNETGVPVCPRSCTPSTPTGIGFLVSLFFIDLLMYGHEPRLLVGFLLGVEFPCWLYVHGSLCQVEGCIGGL